MTTLSEADILQIDRDHIWHPYASSPPTIPNLTVSHASGVYLTLADGRHLIDGMSSWWCALHGYNHPVLNDAVNRQLKDMAHVMFGGLTHAPAAELVKLLVDITPPALQKVFLADSGSVAVEVALKMAIQYWHSQGNTRKTRMLSLKNGYHGDTFGAMSVCDPVTGMHHLFQGVMPQHIFTQSPQCRFHDSWDEKYIEDFHQAIKDNHEELAAVILEPVVQGAGGMKFYSPHYLRRVRALCDQYGVLLIFDEIATGFGRTGKLFACEHADVTPDIMCIGKALTGGYLSLAATLCTEAVSRGICDGEAGVFMHGPTFMGNPLACATAIASTQLLLSSPWQKRVACIESHLSDRLSACWEFQQVADVRVLGAIGVIELTRPVDMARIQASFLRKGIWVRPFGKLVYIMPPFIIEEAELSTLSNALVETLREGNF